jgi:hypothetical protein
MQRALIIIGAALIVLGIAWLAPPKFDVPRDP